MSDAVIRKFSYTDVDEFIRLSKISFAQESSAAGITPENFEHETRTIFRWKMIPYKLLTALIGLKWEGFVAEKDGKVVGGGMYQGRDKRMSITNLMVDPDYRRQGIGQALLIKRLDRLSELGFPFVTAQVLDTNAASLANLTKQNFEIFNQYSVYERNLPFSGSLGPVPAEIAVREVNRADRATFREIEKMSTPACVLQFNGSAEERYFLSGWQKLYDRYARYSRWIKAVVAEERTVAFLSADFQLQQHKGMLAQPVMPDEAVQYLPAMFQKAATWFEIAGKTSMVVEIPDKMKQIQEYLSMNGWKRQYTWLELVRWLGGQAG